MFDEPSPTLVMAHELLNPPLELFFPTEVECVVRKLLHHCPVVQGIGDVDTPFRLRRLPRVREAYMITIKITPAPSTSEIEKFIGMLVGRGINSRLAICLMLDVIRPQGGMKYCSGTT